MTRRLWQEIFEVELFGCCCMGAAYSRLKKLTMVYYRLFLCVVCGLVLVAISKTEALVMQDRPSYRVQFVDVTESAGIKWRHDNAASSEKYLIETMTGGGAMFDYDGDGWLDIYLVNGGETPAYKPLQPIRNALYRNKGDGTFTDVTDRAGVAGLPGRVYNGVAVGDYDNDGWPDIYLTAFGENTLYRNNGNGTFSDVTKKAGVGLSLWSTSAAFFDYDRDGWLDLFVCNYVEWDYDKNVYCGAPKLRSYCHPDTFKGLYQTLYRNNGDGTFVDVSRKAGIAVELGKGLGVVTADFNDDGWDDIYVANDAVRNLLFKNKGDGTFEEIALIAECAYGLNGKPQSGMGVDFGDLDGDGLGELFVTNIDNEPNNVWRNNGDETFSDVTVQVGLGDVAMPYSGFGTRMADFDNDGDLDLFVLNGHPLDNIHLFRDKVRWDEEPFLFDNDGRGKFSNVSSLAGAPLMRRYAGRALAVGDYDNDGDLDLLFVNNGQPPVLLRNDGGNANSWIGLKLRGSRSARDAVGARVKLVCEDRVIVRTKVGGSSYQSAHDPRLLIGIGKSKVKYVEIRWPSGSVERLDVVPTGKYIEVQEKR
ncbi:MAG: CRTAC1 family protein [Acidobacteriota bacterium]|nr:CRTAC1 family protein [Blastocatellia bacterium]MDW8413570.1 CRTAC1 family protein [Acidobacteriota bacterium]